jgi:hypothetical protein
MRHTIAVLGVTIVLAILPASPADAILSREVFFGSSLPGANTHCDPACLGSADWLGNLMTVPGANFTEWFGLSFANQYTHILSDHLRIFPDPFAGGEMLVVDFVRADLPEELCLFCIPATGFIQLNDYLPEQYRFYGVGGYVVTFSEVPSPTPMPASALLLLIAWVSMYAWRWHRAATGRVFQTVPQASKCGG